MALALALAAVLLAATSGLPSLLLRRGSPAAQILALVLVLSAACLGLAGAALGLLAPPSPDLAFPWPAGGAPTVGMDPLSAFFLVPVFLVGGLGACYALGYRPIARHPRTGRRSLVFWGLLVAGLGLLVLARHALSFLLGWEAMALSAFFLVTLDDEERETRRAGLIYLIATHIGTLLLFALFALWQQTTGSWDLRRPEPGTVDGTTAALLFLLMLAAFGLKAGVMPLHFWLPGAHTSAPSQVSAMLSGVVLKMGIYGLLRFLLLLPAPPLSWGVLVLALGATSSLIGVALAIAQHDLKRLLAYHSVENIGIIMMGIGLALLGSSAGRADWMVLGVGAALLHVWNHSLFKSLLFLAAGSVVERTGTRDIDRMGGLARSLPWTAALFLAGAVAISGLPPLNGFVSEFLVYLGAFRSVIGEQRGGPVAMLAIPTLAATGALALACFVKVFGVVFLGNRRTALRPERGESPPSMVFPMVLLALLCLAIGILPGAAARILDPVIGFWVGGMGGEALTLAALVPLQSLGTLALAVLFGVVVAIALLRLRTKGPVAGPAPGPAPGTWDCGYAEPTPRMQYGSASFARSLVSFFAWALRPSRESPGIEGAFPAPSRLESHVGDATLDRLILPFSRLVAERSAWFRRFQQGLTQNYLQYILLTVLVLLGTLIPFGEYFATLLSG